MPAVDIARVHEISLDFRRTGTDEGGEEEGPLFLALIEGKVKQKKGK